VAVDRTITERQTFSDDMMAEIYARVSLNDNDGSVSAIVQAPILPFDVERAEQVISRIAKAVHWASRRRDEMTAEWKRRHETPDPGEAT